MKLSLTKLSLCKLFFFNLFVIVVVGGAGFQINNISQGGSGFNCTTGQKNLMIRVWFHRVVLFNHTKLVRGWQQNDVVWDLVAGPCSISMFSFTTC